MLEKSLYYIRQIIMFYNLSNLLEIIMRRFYNNDAQPRPVFHVTRYKFLK